MLTSASLCSLESIFHCYYWQSPKSERYDNTLAKNSGSQVSQKDLHLILGLPLIISEAPGRLLSPGYLIYKMDEWSTKHTIEMVVM